MFAFFSSGSSMLIHFSFMTMPHLPSLLLFPIAQLFQNFNYPVSAIMLASTHSCTHNNWKYSAHFCLAVLFSINMLPSSSWSSSPCSPFELLCPLVSKHLLGQNLTQIITELLFLYGILTADFTLLISFFFQLSERSLYLNSCSHWSSTFFFSIFAT